MPRFEYFERLPEQGKVEPLPVPTHPLLSQAQERIIQDLEAGLLVKAIAQKHGCHPSVIYDHINAARRRGYKVRAIKHKAWVVRYQVIKPKDSVNIASNSQGMVEP